MRPDDTAYYRQRAVDERGLALSSESREAAEIHEDLARRYQALAEQPELRLGRSDYVTPAHFSEGSRWHSDWTGSSQIRPLRGNLGD